MTAPLLHESAPAGPAFHLGHALGATGVGRFERALAVLGLLLATGAVVPWLHPSAHDPLHPSAGNALSLAIWFGVYGIVALLLVARPAELLDTPIKAKLVWLLVGLAAVSFSWSATPDVALREGAAFVMTTVFAFYLATRFRLREIVRFASWILVVLGVASLSLAVLVPSNGRDHLHAEAWSGVFAGKNDLGRLMALATLLWLLRLVTRDAARPLCVAFVFLSVSLVVASHSRTGLAVALASMLFVCVLAVLRRRLDFALPAFILFVTGAGALFVLLDPSVTSVIEPVDATGTLNGRTEIWRAIWPMAQEHPWLGYGFEGFWRGLDGPSAAVWAMVGFAPAHAHNGILDLLLGLGLVGVLLFSATFILAVRRGFLLLTQASGVTALWPLAFLTFLALYNTTESALVRPNSIFWILYAVLLFQPLVERSRVDR
jgi:O-antigen ligase